MELIDGKKIATQVKQELADEVKRMKAAGAKTPHLVAVLVGNDPASETYVASKVKACQEVGFKSTEMRYSADITEEQADSLLRADLLERYKYFRQYGKDALLLTVLAYNVGHSRLLGYGKRPKSNLIKKIESGDRDIYEEYISYRCYKGKPIPSIERRRKREFQLLYIP